MGGLILMKTDLFDNEQLKIKGEEKGAKNRRIDNKRRYQFIHILKSAILLESTSNNARVHLQSTNAFDSKMTWQAMKGCESDEIQYVRQSIH